MRDLDTKNNFCIVIMMSLSKKTPMIVQVTLATACLLVWGIKATYLLYSRQCFQYKNTLCFQKYRATTKKKPDCFLLKANTEIFIVHPYFLGNHVLFKFNFFKRFIY